MNIVIQNGVVVLEPQLSQIDASVALQFQQTLTAGITEALKTYPGKPFLLDLEKVQFIDSSGLGKILGGIRQVKQSGGSMAVTAQSSAVATLFKIVRLNQMAPVYTDRRSALDGITG
ncbi:STAS domain-containing protein [Spirochaeta lutea]|uniref:Anti-sigma factor antagonist n=1 Tax=Spirochaeta lutea TaxID=1480694 RepID=A0A098QWR0_9SPIO|nr:STAS domain-containing protein [Spirochaeta lutea]KGE72016.1 hypothetical protein DC28_07830 [Spirochaeta lutea]